MEMSKQLQGASILVGMVLCAASFEARAQHPYMQPDSAWVTLSGTVTSVRDDRFRLDYGEGVITVEMDDWDWYDRDRKVLTGDEVTVSGQIDDGLYERRTIEASSVYVESLNTYFHASAADEEIARTPVATNIRTHPGEKPWVNVIGEVAAVDEGRFQLRVGTGSMTVDTARMTYDPLDDEGYQQIDRGDRVEVHGYLDEGFFDQREVEAIIVTTLREDRPKQ